MDGTALFFHAMAPVLTANILTITWVYAFAKITQKERIGEEEGRGTYLWLIVLVFLFMLYGLYTWGVYPLHNKLALPAVPLPTSGRDQTLELKQARPLSANGTSVDSSPKVICQECS